MKALALSAVAALALLMPSAGIAATTIKITNYSFALGAKNGTLHLAGSPFNNGGAQFGQFKLTGQDLSAGGAPVTFLTYCVDLFHVLHVTDTFTVKPLTALFSAARAADMTKLLANVTPTTADQSAAMQLAMWELAFDGNPARDVTSGGSQGQFYMTGGNSSSARTLANGYLASLGGWTTPAGGSAYVLYNARNQSQVFYVKSAVPEPATWGMMIIGFGFAGAALRRRAPHPALATARR